MFESETIRKSFESFESSGSTISGSRVKDTEPFCGRYSLKNPWKIFGLAEEQAGVLLTQNKMVGNKKKICSGFFFFLVVKLCNRTLCIEKYKISNEQKLGQSEPQCYPTNRHNTKRTYASFFGLRFIFRTFLKKRF